MDQYFKIVRLRICARFQIGSCLSYDKAISLAVILRVFASKFLGFCTLSYNAPVYEYVAMLCHVLEVVLLLRHSSPSCIMTDHGC